MSVALLPPEILDLIVDNLRDEPTALKACSTVSKSWGPRAQRCLFSHIEFHSPGPSIASWMKAFPDPNNSPAYYTRRLSIRRLPDNPGGTTYPLAWFRSFRHVTALVISTAQRHDNRISLTQLHGLSPTLQTLDIAIRFIPLREVFGLICSFPLLENLWLHFLDSHDNEDPTTDGGDVPSASPILTGSLYLRGDIRPVSRRLLALPNGLRFSKITVMCRAEDARLVAGLVSKCSDTLESLSIAYSSSGAPSMQSLLDLSNHTRLRDLKFHWHEPDVQWITATLQAAELTCLRQITIRSHIVFVDPIEERIHREWQDLDHLLVRLWDSHSVHPNILYSNWGDLGRVKLTLLPGLVSRGFVDEVGPRGSL